MSKKKEPTPKPAAVPDRLERAVFPRGRPAVRSQFILTDRQLSNLVRMRIVADQLQEKVNEFVDVMGGEEGLTAMEVEDRMLLIQNSAEDLLKALVNQMARMHAFIELRAEQDA